MSCFNLFKCQIAGLGMFTCGKPVSKSAFGGDPSEMSYVCMYVYIYIYRYICELYPWGGLGQ